MKGTLALSWGRSGGFYVHDEGYVRRLCLGPVAITYLPDVEIDDLMEAWVDPEQMSFRRLTRVARRILDVHYPTAIFKPRVDDRDPGVQLVAALRAVDAAQKNQEEER